MFAPPISEESIKNIFEKVRKGFTTPPKVAIAGFGEGGKTALFKTIYGEDAVNVRMRTDATTETSCRMEFGIDFTDSPGVGAGKFSFEKVRQMQVFDRQDLAIHVLNGASPLTQDDEQLHELIEQSGAKRVTVVNTPEPLSDEDRDEYAETIKEKLGLLPKDVLFISVEQGNGIAQLIQHIVDILPEEMRDAFIAQQQADLKIKEKRIRSAVYSKAVICAATAAIPIPVADILIITPIQVTMVITIGFFHGIDMLKVAHRIPEFITTLGAGVGLREAARQVVKLVPGYGQVASASIAFAGTIALGEAANVWFKNNMKIEVGDLKTVFQRTAEQAEKEYGEHAKDADAIKQKIDDLQEQLNSGTISQEEFERRLAELD